MKLRKGLGLLAPAVVIAMTAAACGGSQGGGGTETGGGGGQIKNGGVLRYGADQEPTGFNVNTSSDNGTAAANVVVGVLPNTFYIHPDFTVQYDKALLAEEPKVETVNGKQVVTYKIKPEAKWSDGTDISSDDFEYLWKSITSKGFDVAATTGYEQIESVTGQDNKKTVAVTYAKPFSDWQGLFTNILPAHYMKAQESKFGGAKGAWEKAIKESLPVSGGPWLIKSFNKTSKIVTLVRNDKYWGEKPHLDQMVFQILSDSSQQPAALKNSEVDMIYPQPQLDLVAQVKKLETDVKSEVNFGLSFEHLDFNTQNKFLGDVKVRQAIAYALDRDAIVKAGPAQFDQKASVLNNRMWLSNQPEYKDNAGDYKSRNVDKAKSLLQEAGYSPGADGIMAKGGQKISVRFSTVAGNKLREQTGILVKSQLKDAGIDVKIDNVPSDILFGERLPSGNFDITLFAWVGSPFAASGNYAIYHSATAANRQSNYGLLSDKRIDQAFEQVVGELDRQKMVDTLNQIDAWAWEDMVTIPLYQKPTFLAYRTTFGNIADNASQQGPFWNSNTFYKK